MANLLIDTVSFLWILNNDRKLSRKARETFVSPRYTRYLSVISLWEMSIKYKIGKLNLELPPSLLVPEQCEARDIALLPLESQDALKVDELPLLHGDPFDRMLICQALSRRMVILTPDMLIQQYKVATIW